MFNFNRQDGMNHVKHQLPLIHSMKYLKYRTGALHCHVVISWTQRVSIISRSLQNSWKIPHGQNFKHVRSWRDWYRFWRRMLPQCTRVGVCKTGITMTTNPSVLITIITWHSFHPANTNILWIITWRTSMVLEARALSHTDPNVTDSTTIKHV